MIKEKHTLVNSRALQEYTGYIFELGKLAEDMLKGSRKRVKWIFREKSKKHSKKSIRKKLSSTVLAVQTAVYML